MGFCLMLFVPQRHCDFMFRYEKTQNDLTCRMTDSTDEFCTSSNRILEFENKAFSLSLFS